MIQDDVSKIFQKLYSVSKPEIFHPSEKDIYLVSYPRSGNTWMRVLLAEILYGKSGDSLKDIEYYIPDIHFQPLKRNVLDGDFHIVKSHSQYLRTKEMEKYKRIIYLIRDPRDVVLSHFRYMSARGYENDLDHFLMDWLAGRIWPTSWREHINSWTGIGMERNVADVCVIHYEDLLSEPISQVCKILDFIGLQKGLDAIQRAIELSSPENMRKKEKLGLRHGEDVKGMKFIGEAVNGKWKEKLNTNQVKLIEEYSFIEMKYHGYL